MIRSGRNGGGVLAAVVGPSVRAARKRRGMSQKALAAAIGVGRVWICNIEKGHALPSLPALVRLADCLGASADELLGRQLVVTPTEET